MSDKEYLPVRLSHLLRHCSVGAIVRGPEYSLVVQDIRNWMDRGGSIAAEEIRYVDRIKSALEIDYALKKPPVASIGYKGKVEGVCIPASRFPFWMRCKACGLLHFKPWTSLQHDAFPHCQETNRKICKKRPKLEQVPWVLVHQNGYLDDVPWHRLAHSHAVTAEQKNCKSDKDESYLRLIENAGSKRVISCLRCKSKNTFNPQNMKIKLDRSTKEQPWLYSQAPESDEPGYILDMSDARVHRPVNRNALVIPPESRVVRGSIVDRLYQNASYRDRLESAYDEYERQFEYKDLAKEMSCLVSDIKSAFDQIDAGYPNFGETVTAGLLLETEYEALTTELPDLNENEDFVTEHFSKQWKQMAQKFENNTRHACLIDVIDNVIGVNRLKELLIYEGFTRLNKQRVAPDIAGISDWLPALELYGEGIFFTLNDDALCNWEAIPAVRSRADYLLRRFKNAEITFDQEQRVDGRFLLLHTLSHLLIRELESIAGYPASSLKERLYSAKGGELPMSGILIYTAVPDIVGSLGGLAELATPDRFIKLVSSVFDHAEWCSADPICAEHEGQGPDLLNLSACHSCSLTPEPCCAFGNILLDRTFIKGDDKKGIPGFLQTLARR